MLAVQIQHLNFPGSRNLGFYIVVTLGWWRT